MKRPHFYNIIEEIEICKLKPTSKIKMDKMDVIASTSTEYTIAQVSNLYEDKTNEEQSDNTEVQKKFVLPPEYDETDSRWTLKYREPAPGLVELIEHSGVYVNADKLADCEKWSSNCKTFARMLLTEIFTTNALSICSWTNETTNGGQARPGLDEHARNILQTYIVKYGQIRDWNRTDFQCIMKSIRQILLEMRLVRQRDDEDKALQKHQIYLPPEYDNTNSRWTLKYHEYAPGLVELIKDSCVYVEANQLDKCKKSSNNSMTLVRLLLNEIFTKIALSTCSWDPSSKDSDCDETSARPELDENAMTTLLKFVADYELKNDWQVTYKKVIEKHILQKMELLRRVATRIDADERLRNNLRERIDPPPQCNLVGYETESRWTLKYREPAPGLIELIEHSGVYVDADKLAECKEKSEDSETLARKLLTEVFTTDALRKCTLSRQNHEVYSIPHQGRTSIFTNLLSLQLRPELDAYAELIILNFVDEYAMEKGWAVLSFQSIRNSMINKIIKIRERSIDKARERRLAAFCDRVGSSKSTVCTKRQTVTNTVGPRNPKWTSFYMKEYNFP